MLRNSRIRFLLLVMGLVVAVNLGRQGYRWFAHADERADLRHLSVQLDSSGLLVVRTGVEAARLREEIEEADAWLAEQREALDAAERRAGGGGVSPVLYEGYRRALDRYNAGVHDRNRLFEEWRTVVAENHTAVDRYNATADSMRAVGARMGEPYLDIPSPAEVAARKGEEVGGGR